VAKTPVAPVRQIISWLVRAAFHETRELKLLHSLQEYGGPQLVRICIPAPLEQFLEIAQRSTIHGSESRKRG
jgi:hypothetical protein